MHPLSFHPPLFMHPLSFHPPAFHASSLFSSPLFSSLSFHPSLFIPLFSSPLHHHPYRQPGLFFDAELLMLLSGYANCYITAPQPASAFILALADRVADAAPTMQPAVCVDAVCGCCVGCCVWTLCVEDGIMRSYKRVYLVDACVCGFACLWLYVSCMQQCHALYIHLFASTYVTSSTPPTPHPCPHTHHTPSSSKKHRPSQSQHGP